APHIIFLDDDLGSDGLGRRQESGLAFLGSFPRKDKRSVVVVYASANNPDKALALGADVVCPDKAESNNLPAAIALALERHSLTKPKPDVPESKHPSFEDDMDDVKIQVFVLIKEIAAEKAPVFITVTYDGKTILTF